MGEHQNMTMIKSIPSKTKKIIKRKNIPSSIREKTHKLLMNAMIQAYNITPFETDKAPERTIKIHEEIL